MSLVGRCRNEIGLHEWHVPAGLDQSSRKFVRLHPAILVEHLPAFRRQTLDTGFDRDASGSAEKLEHVGLPKVYAGLDSELQPAIHHCLEQRAIGQENLVYEIQISDALRLEGVDLLHEQIEIALAIFVP